MTFTAPAAPAAVADHYRARLRQAGFPTLSDAFANGARMVSASRPNGAERVDIQIAPAPEGSRVTVAYVVSAR